MEKSVCIYVVNQCDHILRQVQQFSVKLFFDKQFTITVA